jgi:hypothetical protein
MPPQLNITEVADRWLTLRFDPPQVTEADEPAESPIEPVAAAAIP